MTSVLVPCGFSGCSDVEPCCDVTASVVEDAYGNCADIILSTACPDDESQARND